MDTFGIVPVKRFSRAKCRLGDVLTSSERARLAQAMFQDVLVNLRKAKSLTDIIVVSADPDALSIANSLGVRKVFDTKEAGINDAVQLAFDAIADRNSQVMVVPADVPFATSPEFDAVTELLDVNPIVITPAMSDGGTNALAMRSINLISPCYGNRSFARHRALAREKSLCCSVLRSEGLGRDIDRAIDFGPFLFPHSPIGQTSGLLCEFDLSERMELLDAPAPLRLF